MGLDCRSSICGIHGRACDLCANQCISERETTDDMWETESFPRYNIRSKASYTVIQYIANTLAVSLLAVLIVQWCLAVPMAHVGLFLAAMPRLLHERTVVSCHSQNVITFQFPRFLGRTTLAIIISVQSFNLSPFYIPFVRKLFAILFFYSLVFSGHVCANYCTIQGPAHSWLPDKLPDSDNIAFR